LAVVQAQRLLFGVALVMERKTSPQRLLPLRRTDGVAQALLRLMEAMPGVQIIPAIGQGDGAVHVLAGSIEEAVDLIIARREQYGFSHVQVLEQRMESFAPFVARLAEK